MRGSLVFRRGRAVGRHLPPRNNTWLPLPAFHHQPIRGRQKKGPSVIVTGLSGTRLHTGRGTAYSHVLHRPRTSGRVFIFCFHISGRAQQFSRAPKTRSRGHATKLGGHGGKDLNTNVHNHEPAGLRTRTPTNKGDEKTAAPCAQQRAANGSTLVS